MRKRNKIMEIEKVTFDDWDPAEDIETKEDVVAYLAVALEENDPEFLLRTIGHIARSKGMTQLDDKKTERDSIERCLLA
jgi:probable addiction module antidote protein